MSEHRYDIDAYVPALKAWLASPDRSTVEIREVVEQILAAAAVPLRDRPITFAMDASETQKYREWEPEANKRAAQRQLDACGDDEERRAEMLGNQQTWNGGGPYDGASGGGTTFMFTPTSLGTIVCVKHHGEEVNLTDYGAW
jgi:hypothetical protein